MQHQQAVECHILDLSNVQVMIPGMAMSSIPQSLWLPRLSWTAI
jgi:hypothetical protein